MFLCFCPANGEVYLHTVPEYISVPVQLNKEQEAILKRLQISDVLKIFAQAGVALQKLVEKK